MSKNKIVYLKWGDRYTQEHVDRLYDQVNKNCSIDFDFITMDVSVGQAYDEMQALQNKYFRGNQDPESSITVNETQVFEREDAGGIAHFRKYIMFMRDHEFKDCTFLYLDLDTIIKNDLSYFFESYSRDTSPRDLAKAVLAEDDFFERWWDTTDNVYRDVIDELDSTNEARLVKYILNEIGNRDLNLDDYDDDLFHEFSEEQGTENTFQITNSNVMNLIGDESAMDELLNGDLYDLKSELHSIHNNAYNNAYESECYELVMDGLQEYFVGKFDWEEIKQSNGKIKYFPKIKIRDFYSNVLSYLEENIHYNTLDFQGSYTEMMNVLFYDGTLDEISFRIPDYPDYQLVDKYINEYFGDYI